MDDYLSKPFKLDDILKILENYSHGTIPTQGEDISKYETEGEMSKLGQFAGDQREKGLKRNASPINLKLFELSQKLEMWNENITIENSTDLVSS